ncbi:GvpL/GvpF family gas vesicle protein [Streptomyces sp. S3(2020)]|uniref:GvpL/GvpF family gas vesicle protein n=1 Tax=Streptomyces sp. S3(2020) TaxID=2732044 RepID=UPI001488679D|nr:GvpL/GvpF family gas vesicle protein [Streptomyces sp. S3(2020)]NNN35759.1 GvpL/GvpF family gas vesicle protein [Streptomyces sp. S3(2020)]
MMGLRYVYAVCRPFKAPLQAQLRGVAGDPPRLLVHHGLVAVVSHVPERDFAEGPLHAHIADQDWLGETTRAHQGVIDALTVVTTPLPLRLATVFRDDSGVRTMLEARDADFRRTLDRLEGRVEWGVKVYAEAGPPDGDAPAQTAASRLHGTLSAYAEESRLHAPQNAALSGAAGRNVLNAAYLVPRTDSEEFVELVDRTKHESPGTRVELTGPWAAYSFAGDKP